MALFEIATLGSFAKLLLAARKLAEDADPLNRLKALADLAENGGKLSAALKEQNLGPLAARIEAECKAADAAFARAPGLEDAQAVFRDAAAVALTRCDALARNGLEQAVIVQDMVDAVKASDHARDFHETEMAETYFRAVMDAGLTVILADVAFIDGLTPQLWRESLRRQGVAVELLAEVRQEQQRETSRAEERHRELLAHVRATGETQRLAEAGVTEEALIELAERIAKDVDDVGQAWTELQNAIEIAIRVQEEGRHGSNLGDFVDEVLRRVADLSKQGAYDDAAAEIDAALDAGEAEHKARTIRLLDAGLEQDRLRRNAEAAARRVLRMAETEAGGAFDFEALRTVRREWRERGRDKGLLFDQEVSIELARIETSRAQTPDELGNALNDLGISLQELGQREARTERLEQAVTAYRAALEEWTRERVPLDWAMVQMNLGSALLTLGEREAGTGRLEQAVTAYRAALEERTRERVPLDWAMTQMNLGTALRVLGEREAGTARLEQAVTAYRAALEERTRERVPLDWAMTQMNLGTALRVLGEREAGTARLEQAVTAYRAALEERTRERVPLDWAMTQMNLGNALQTLGQREAGTERLEQAVTAYRAALEEWTRERVPLDWATVQMNLGATLRKLGSREGSIERLEEALAAYNMALEELTRERVPLDWALLTFNKCFLELAIFEETGEAARLDAAEGQVRAAREVFEAAGATQYLGMADEQLAAIAARRG